jgi:chromate reductase, NAD(P)H dehydrogenase (quinone)
VRILAIPGSLRAGSHNVALARAAVELAPKGVEIEVFDGLGALPLYDDDLDGEETPQAVADLRERISSADALLVVTPEYNGSVSGVLKNAIDWASRPRGEAALRGTTVAIAGVTTGQYGAMWAQQDLRRILGIAGARVMDGDLPVSRAATVFDDSGRLVDELVEGRLRDHLAALASEVQVPVAAAA